jgi:flagellar motor switch protein FliG
MMTPVKTNKLYHTFVTIYNTKFSNTDEAVRAVEILNKIPFTLLQNVFRSLPISDKILKNISRNLIFASRSTREKENGL